MARISILFFLCLLSQETLSQADTIIPIPILDEGYFDDLYEIRYVDTTTYLKYHQNKYHLFIKYVYTPAVFNNNLSSGNLQLLNNLKKYLKCTDPRDASTCGVDILPIWPVYEFGYITGQNDESEDIYQRYVSIFTEFPFVQKGYYTNTNDK
jgi:hypothetical protein